MAKVNLNIKAPEIEIERGAKFAISLPERAGALPEPLQMIARQYLSVRRRSGEALIDMGRWLRQAKQAAQHGEWSIFLEATDTRPDTAERLMNIYQTAQENAQFADAITRNWLTQSAAALLARDSTPPEIVDQALHSPKPPTKRQIESSIRETKIRTGADFGQARLPDMPAPATPADLPPEYAIIQRRLAAHNIALLSNMQGHHRAFVTRKEGMTGVVTFDWADVLSKLERLEAEPPSKESDVAFRRTCPTCGETILNGIWGDRQECGKCYHARQRAPATPIEQKQPTSSEVDEDDDPPVEIAQAGRVLAEHGYATRLGSDDLWEVRREGKVTSVLTRTQMITHAAALTFLTERRAVLARFDRQAMISQADYHKALDQIAALVE